MVLHRHPAPAVAVLLEPLLWLLFQCYLGCLLALKLLRQHWHPQLMLLLMEPVLLLTRLQTRVLLAPLL
jgi:hypothetical protein